MLFTQKLLAFSLKSFFHNKIVLSFIMKSSGLVQDEYINQVFFKLIIFRNYLVCNHKIIFFVMIWKGNLCNSNLQNIRVSDGQGMSLLIIINLSLSRKLYFPLIILFTLKLEGIKLRDKVKILSQYQLYVLSFCCKACDFWGRSINKKMPWLYPHSL